MTEALQSLYRGRFGEAPRRVSALKGDGSARRLFRLFGRGRTAIGALNDDRQENRAFIGFSRHFRACGLPVPEIYAAAEDEGAYIEEDLGDETLFGLLSRRRRRGALPEDVLAVYRRAVHALPRFQIDAGRTLDYSLCYPRPAFDRQSMLWDLNYFKYYFLRLAKIPFHEQALEDDFRRFADLLLKAPSGFFLYRDFQSRNIMVRGGEPWFLDYQGGRRGALAYDIASLLYDAKADLPVETRDELLSLYIKEAGRRTALDRAAFLSFYPGFVYVRIMQALGAYGLRGFYEGKSHFLASIPYAVRNIEHLLRTTRLPAELPALMGVFRRIVASSALRQYGAASLELTVRVQSFSYTGGMPADEKGHGGGFVFDCRALPNPGRQARFAKLTGRDKPVADYLRRQKAVGSFLKGVRSLVDPAVRNYSLRNFTDLLVSFGCTGGQHRSVYCSETLARHLRDRLKVRVEVSHRELERAQAV